MDKSKESKEFVFTLKNDWAFKRLLGVEENKAIPMFPRMCVRLKK